MSEERQVIWEAKLDGRYECRVERLADYRGLLTVRDGERQLLSEEVALAYGAVFGPDVDDVYSWQERCVEIIDGGGNNAD